MNKEKINNKEKKIDEDVKANMTPEQLAEIKILEDELKRLQGENLLAEMKYELEKKIKQTKQDKNIKGKGLLKAYARLLKKGIRWWTMADLTPEQRAERKKKFEEATANLFGQDNNSQNQPGFNIFGDQQPRNRPKNSFLDEKDDEPYDFLGIFSNGKTKKPQNSKNHTKKGGKTTKKRSKSKKKTNNGYIMINGVRYKKADKKQVQQKKKKTKKTTRRRENNDYDDEPEPFFNLTG